jgi:hypothetical protein
MFVYKEREDIDTVLCKNPKWGNFDLVKCGDSMINNMEKLPLLHAMEQAKTIAGKLQNGEKERTRKNEKEKRERNGVLMLYDNNYSSIIDFYF